MRPIYADALIISLRLEYPMIPMFKESRKEWEEKTEGYRKAEEIINEAPTIKPKQGKWIESFKSVEVKRGAYIGTKFIHDGWSCSECSEVVEKKYPNCPYCLARMKGANDE